MGKIDFTLPLPEKYLHNRYDKVFKNLKKSLSVTIVGLPLSSRSGFLKFILESDSKLLDKFIDSKKFKFIIIDGKNLSDADLLRKIIIKLGYSDSDPLIAQSKFENQLKSTIDKTKIVVTIPDFDEQLRGKPETIDFLTRIWKANKHNPNKSGVLFCLTASSIDFEKCRKIYSFDFCEIVNETLVKFDLLDANELLYTKKRLEHFRNTTIAKEIHDIATKLSGGHYILYKSLTSFNLEELKTILRIKYHPLINDLVIKIWESSHLKVSPLFPPRNYNKEKMTNNLPELTAQEHNVFKHLNDNLEKIITRDEIGQAMWGKLWLDKYSDWAIDKQISKLKTKLTYTKYKILTLRKQGYKIIKYD